MLTRAYRRLFGRRPNRNSFDMDVVVVSRPACGLCDEALQLLGQLGCSPTIVNVDEDAELAAEYGECVPVVLINGKVRFRGRINPVLLRRLLHAQSIAETPGSDEE